IELDPLMIKVVQKYATPPTRLQQDLPYKAYRLPN
ncbi:unnamed protein product, partial [marine sediment metagenome]